LLRALDLRAQQLDVGLALGKRERPRGPRGRGLHQALALLRPLHPQRHDLAFDAQAGVALLAGRALALQHLLARFLAAVFAQLDELGQREALAHAGNSLRSACADCSNGTSSEAGCCSSWRIGPMRSMAMSASGSLPRWYSPS